MHRFTVCIPILASNLSHAIFLIRISLANSELYLALAAIVRRFDMVLFETDESDVEITWDGFAGGFRPESRGVQVKVTGLRR